LRKLQVQAIGRYLFLVQNLERIDAGGASIAAWLHQFIVHRFTFVLFRLYATAVVSRRSRIKDRNRFDGVCVGGCCHVIWPCLGLVTSQHVASTSNFGVAAYRDAHSLSAAAIPDLVHE
jgi:hypothetical protein